MNSGKRSTKSPETPEGTITGGPNSITVNSPEMARRRTHLTSYLRFESTFPKRIQELAILATARAFDCPYIWNAHAPAARSEGVSDAARGCHPGPAANAAHVR